MKKSAEGHGSVGIRWLVRLNVAIMLLVAVAITGCQENPARKAEQLRNVTLAYTNQYDSALVQIALTKGYFAQEGLAVQPQRHSFGREALSSVLAGKADLATVAETPFILAVLNGERIAVIASIFSSSMNHGIVANRERGISVPGDLRGKRIGFTPGTTSEFFLDSFLTINNLERRELTTVSLKPDEMGEAIATNQVDAVCTWGYPLALIRKELAARGTTFFDHEIYNERFILAGHDEYLRGNRETIRRVLRAMLKAEEFAAAHAGEAQALVASSLKIDQQLLRTLWGEGEFRVSLDQMLLVTLEDETRWAIKNRLAKGTSMPNYLNHIYFEGLEAVKPDAVRIGR